MTIQVAIIVSFLYLMIGLLLIGKIYILLAENKALRKIQSTMSNSLRLKGIEVDRLLKRLNRLEKEKK